MSNIFRYPLAPPVASGDGGTLGDSPTEAIDYVMFHRHRINYKDSTRSYYGRSFPDSSGLVLDHNERRVYMAMPTALQTQYQPQYKQVDVGVAGVAAMGLLNDNSVEDVARTVSSAAAAALPEFASSTLAGGIGGFNQLLGLGGGLDSNGIQALTRGRVFNPFKEQLFQSMAFRTHNFTFKMVSRSKEEAQRVKDIINYFKQGAVPAMGKSGGFKVGEGGAEGSADAVSKLFGDGQVAGSRFFQIPDSFDIKFLRMKADGSVSAPGEDFLHFKVHPSVCTGINVNYTPDGQYTSFKDIDGTMVQVPAINLILTFTELKLVTRGDVEKGF